MRELAGCPSRRQLLGLSPSLALFALAAFSVAAPARAADLGYGSGAPQEYGVLARPEPEPGYGESAAPAPPEYRVLVYPPRPRYAGPQSFPPPGYPPRAHDGEYYYDGPYDHRAGVAPRPYASRPVYREIQVPRPQGDLRYEPYGRAIVPDAPAAPGLAELQRW